MYLMNSVTDFLNKLYSNENFGIALIVILIILVILFIIVLIFGKKDEKKRKLEETMRLEKANIEAMAAVNQDVIENNEVSPDYSINNTQNETNEPKSDFYDEPQSVIKDYTMENPILTQNFQEQEAIAKNIGNDFNDLATSINNELNDIDNLKEIKDSIQQQPLSTPQANDLFVKPDDMNTPIVEPQPSIPTEEPQPIRSDIPQMGSIPSIIEQPVVEQPVIAPVQPQSFVSPIEPQPTTENVNITPEVPQTNSFGESTERIVTPEEDNSYVPPISTYKETPYVPTTQFSSVNVTRVDEEPQITPAPTPTPVVEEPKVQPMGGIRPRPAFDLPILNKRVDAPAETKEENSNVKPSNTPKFAFEAEDEDTYNI